MTTPIQPTQQTQPTRAAARRIAPRLRRLLMGALWLFGIAVISGGVRAGPPDIESQLREIARLQESVEGPGTTLAGRLESLDKVIAARAALIDSAESDDRAPTWMLDQATAILRRAGRDGADASVVYGIPTPQQLRRIRDAAGEAGRLVRRADEQAARIVTRLQATIFDAKKGDAAAVRAAAQQAESRLAILVDTEQAWRIGLLRARIVVLLAAADDAPASALARSKLLTSTIETLGTIVTPTDPPDAEVTRRLMLGASKLLLARERNDAPGSGPDSRPGPKQDFGWLLQRLGGGDRPTDVYLVMQAASGLSLCCTTAQEAQNASEALLNFTDNGQNRFGITRTSAAAMLGGETTARLYLLTTWAANAGPARSTPEQNAAWINKALAGLVAALDVPPSEEMREGWRRLVYAKIAGVVDPSMPLDRITPHAAFARALQLAGPDPEPGEDAAGGARDRRHAEATRLFRLVEQREDAGNLRAEALWEAASLTIPRGEQDSMQMGLGPRLETAAMLLRLANQYPDSPRLRDAIGTAVWVTRVATPPGTPAEQVAKLRELQQATREKAVVLVPPLPGDLVCRLELGRILSALARSESANPAASLDDARRAVQLLTQAAADPALAPLADQDIGILFDHLFDQAAPNPLSDADRAECAQAAVEWAGRRAPDRRPLYELALAEAWQASGEAKSAKVFADLAAKLEPAVLEKLPAGEQAVLRAGDARIRLGHGRAQRAAGDTKQAFETLRKLADDLDHEPDDRTAPASKPSRSPEFWAAWAELVEMLAADNPQGDRTATIRLQLNRLALLDAGLGPEPYATRLKKIQSSIK